MYCQLHWLARRMRDESWTVKLLFSRFQDWSSAENIKIIVLFNFFTYRLHYHPALSAIQRFVLHHAPHLNVCCFQCFTGLFIQCSVLHSCLHVLLTDLAHFFPKVLHIQPLQFGHKKARFYQNMSNLHRVHWCRFFPHSTWKTGSNVIHRPHLITNTAVPWVRPALQILRTFFCCQNWKNIYHNQ